MALKKFSFNVIAKDKFSRLGLIKTHRGNIETPVFMPVGTQGTVKATFIEDIKKTLILTKYPTNQDRGAGGMPCTA